MKAAVVNEFKEKLEVKEVPKPKAGLGEVLVHIKHAAFAIQIYMRRTVIGR